MRSTLVQQSRPVAPTHVLAVPLGRGGARRDHSGADAALITRDVNTHPRDAGRAWSMERVAIATINDPKRGNTT